MELAQLLNTNKVDVLKTRLTNLFNDLRREEGRRAKAEADLAAFKKEAARMRNLYLKTKRTDEAKSAGAKRSEDTPSVTENVPSAASNTEPVGEGVGGENDGQDLTE